MATSGDYSTIGQGIGAGFSIAGGVYSAITGSEDASAEAGIQKQEINTEMQENETRRTAMELTSRRQETQNIRQAQLARSMALSIGTNQGGGGFQQGSAAGGAYGSIGGQAGLNTLGISQNLQIGEKMFDLTGQMDREKMAMADAQARAAGHSAFGKLLGGIGSSAGGIGSLLGLLPLA